MFSSFVDFFWISAGVVDQDVDAAEFFKHCVHKGADFFAAGQIPGKGNGPAAVCLDHCDGFVKIGLCAGDGHDGGAFSGGSQSGGAADAFSCAGDDGDFIL